MSKKLKAARTRGVQILAWTSMGAALVGGPLVAGTFVGDAVDTVLSALPWAWVPVVVLAVLFVVFVRDLVVDWEPNRQAIYTLLVMPSVARASAGELGATIGDWSRAALDVVADPLRGLLGTGAPVGLAVIVAATALLLAQRSVKAGKTTTTTVAA